MVTFHSSEQLISISVILSRSDRNAFRAPENTHNSQKDCTVRVFVSHKQACEAAESHSFPRVSCALGTPRCARLNTTFSEYTKSTIPTMLELLILTGCFLRLYYTLPYYTTFGPAFSEVLSLTVPCLRSPSGACFRASRLHVPVTRPSSSLERWPRRGFRGRLSSLHAPHPLPAEMGPDALRARRVLQHEGEMVALVCRFSTFAAMCSPPDTLSWRPTRVTAIPDGGVHIRAQSPRTLTRPEVGGSR